MSVLAGCNSGGDQLPDGSTVVLRPDSFEWTIQPQGDNCIIDPNLYQDQMFSIMVLNSAGNAIGEAPLTISLDLSGNTFSGYPVLELYDDYNGNGVADGPEELVSSNTDTLYETATEKYTAEKILILRINLSCPYQGNLYAFSGGYLGTLHVTVQEETNTTP